MSDKDTVGASRRPALPGLRFSYIPRDREMLEEIARWPYTVAFVADGGFPYAPFLYLSCNPL